MAFTYTNNISDAAGKKYASGTYTNTGGSTGGDIKTGLSRVELLHLQPNGSSVSSDQPVVNETLPSENGDVTIVTSANEVGTWFAIGQ